MVLDALGEQLRGTLRRIANAPNIDAALVKDAVRDIQRALLGADVNVKLVLEISKNIQRRALEEKPLPGMSNREHVIHIVHDELVKVLGGTRDISLKKQTVMMVGLYGQGKTTTTGKLAKYFQKKGLRVGLIGADVHRPAAYDQLKTLADALHIPVYGDPKGKDAVKIVNEGKKHFAKTTDVVIVDTSGRHKLEPELIDEMKQIFEAVKPEEKFLVMDAAVGQQAGPQAKAFHDTVGLTGVIITKLDGTAKGGGALSAAASTGAPITFIGVGERVDDFEKFDPTRFIGRLLGMGDLEALLEKAQEAAEGKDVEKTARKIMSGKFTLNDMYAQMEMLGKMGPLSKVMGMLPGNLGGQLKGAQMEETQAKLKKFRVIMDSMTEEELDNPQLLKASRQRRVARGSGVDVKQVKDLLQYYNMSKRMMKGFGTNRKAQRQLMKQLKFKG